MFSRHSASILLFATLLVGCGLYVALTAPDLLADADVPPVRILSMR